MISRTPLLLVLGALAGVTSACSKPSSGNGDKPSSSTSTTVAASPSPSQASLAKLQPGDAPPAFTATASNGTKVDLAAWKGKNVVVYFYPKDDTPGCTKEAQSFRDASAKLQESDIVVVGVSEQNDESHKAFADKYELTFALVADTDGSIAQKFGVPVNNGYASRMSFLIGKDGKIKKVYPKVDPSAHTEEILKDAASG